MEKLQYILYIDDEENQLSFKALFRREFPIFTVGDVSAGKQLMDQHDIKIVLCNQRFPGVAAFDFFRWTRENYFNVKRVLIYSDYDPNNYINENLSDDLVHQYFWKPWKSDEMEALLRKWWQEIPTFKTPQG